VYVTGSRQEVVLETGTKNEPYVTEEAENKENPKGGRQLASPIPLDTKGNIQYVTPLVNQGETSTTQVGTEGLESSRSRSPINFKLCPECKEPLIKGEGCVTCPKCGWSKCDV